MTIFEINDKKLTATFRRSLIAFAVMVLLANCSSSRFVEGNWDLLGLGQQMARDSCKKHINFNVYQACISQIDENYDEALHELNQKRRSY